MADFERDPTHWLRRLSPDEWVRAALGELKRAEVAFAAHQGRAGITGCKRAAGMALNAVLIHEPRERWGRSYVEHVEALAKDEDAPEAVRAACRALRDAQPPGAELVSLRVPSSNERLLEAARDVIAHAYAIVVRHTGE